MRFFLDIGADIEAKDQVNKIDIFDLFFHLQYVYEMNILLLVLFFYVCSFSYSMFISGDALPFTLLHLMVV